MTDSRRLATILAIDIAGFSRAAERDEIAAARHVLKLRSLVSAEAEPQRGRIFNTAGDGLMLEFPTLGEGVAAALDIAEALAAHPDLPPVRMGLNVGDVTVIGDGDLIGTGVNVAARIQQLAQPGEILTTGDVRNLFATSDLAQFTPYGNVQLDKMSRQVSLFALAPTGVRVRKTLIGRLRGLGVWSRRAALAAALLALGAGLYFAWRAIDPPLATGVSAAPQSAVPVIAVLPFENLSGDPSLQYFSDGMTEEIQYALSRIPGLRVVSRPADFGVREANGLARGTDASHVLSGSVRRNGSELRVFARLTRGASGEIVWTESFERPLAESLAVQDEIARRVARALSVVAPETAHADPVDPRAFELYLRGRDLWRSGGEGEGGIPQSAIADLEEAVRIAPGFARAWTALASAYAQKQNWLLGAEQDAVIEQAVAAARKALEIDPDMGEPYIVLGRFSPSRDWAERGAILARALAAQPNDPDVQMLYATFWLNQIGQIDDARRLLRRAFEADPLSGLMVGDYFQSLVNSGNDAILERLILDNRDTHPEYQHFWPMVIATRLLSGDLAAARSLFEGYKAYLATTDYAGTPKESETIEAHEAIISALESKDPARIDEIQRHIEAEARRGQAAAVTSIVDLAIIGRVDAAMAMAEELYLRDGYRPPAGHVEHRYVPMRYSHGRVPTSFLLGPHARPLQRDPRIWTIFAATGLARFWQETGQWPDFCEAPDLGYDCAAAAAKALAGQRMN